MGKEGAAEDMPIYLQVLGDQTWNRNKPTFLWYVIEEKTGEEEDETIDKGNYLLDERKQDKKDPSDGSTCRTTRMGRIIELNANEKCRRDRIRALRFPELGHGLFCSLVVSGTVFYLLSGRRLAYYGISPDSTTAKTVHYWDSRHDPDEGWQEGPSLNVERTRGQAAALEDGSVLIMGPVYDELDPPVERLVGSPRQGYWQGMPDFVDESGGSHYFQGAKLLAVHGSHLFFQMFDTQDWLGVCFNVVSGKWHIFDHAFRGKWSSGVVLYDRYLFTFGNETPDGWSPCSIRVYDLHFREWLPCPVKFPDNDTRVALITPSLDTNHDLLRVNDNKLAVLCYESSYDIEHEEPLASVRWIKFTVRRTSPDASFCQQPQFHAEVVSHGNCLLEGAMLLNSAVPVAGPKEVDGLSKEGFSDNKDRRKKRISPKKSIPSIVQAPLKGGGFAKGLFWKRVKTKRNITRKSITPKQVAGLQ